MLELKPVQADRDADVIKVDQENTVKSLRDQLLGLVSGDEDKGFPILRQDDGGMRMVGYIGANELEHALSMVCNSCIYLKSDRDLGIVADEAESQVSFHPTSPYNHGTYGTSSISSLMDGDTAEGDPFDFSIYMDKAPLTVQTNSPLELVQEFFVKLGARYVVVTDSDGYCE